MQVYLLVASAGPSHQEIQHKGAALVLSVCPGCLISAPGTVSASSTAFTLLLSLRVTPVTMARRLDHAELASSVTMDCAKVKCIEKSSLKARQDSLHYLCFILFQLAALTVPCPMKTGTAALPSVLVLKERETVKRTPNVPRVSSVAITTVISRARLRTAAAQLLPGARPSVPVVWGEAAVRMTSAEDPPGVEMTESAPVLKTAPRPRLTGTAAPRSVPVKRGRGTVIRIVTVWEILCVGLVPVTLRE